MDDFLAIKKTKQNKTDIASSLEHLWFLHPHTFVEAQCGGVGKIDSSPALELYMVALLIALISQLTRRWDWRWEG